MWAKKDLEKLIQEKLQDYLFIVVSNRQPYVHVYAKGKIECQRGVGGVITALDPVMQACHGTWVAFGNGDADRKVTAPDGKLPIPAEHPAYTLRRIWLTKEEEQGYYYGYSNEALWPLSHMVFRRPVFREEDWAHYKKVNEKFARAVIEEVKDKKAFVWIQDYHLCLLPKYLKEMARKQLIIAHFWHIPWPSYEAFQICPQKKEILESLLHNDLLGFHTRYHCNNFLDVVDRELESKIDRERVSITKNEHETLIRPYPISVDFEGINELANSPMVTEIETALIQEFELFGRKILIGLDRIDYTKGIPERFRAVDLLLERHPELREKIVFLQIGVISRLHIPEYKILNDEINSLVERINWRHSREHWKPIIFVRRHFSLPELLALYRISQVGIVSSLHDGMNLVAKEYVASCFDAKGMLVLSQFTGAARELTDAILINPYDLGHFSEEIFHALNLSDEERLKRVTKMREVVKTNNIFRWAGKALSELLKLEFVE